MPLASASRRSRRIALRLREESAPRKSSKLRVAVVEPVELLVVREQEALERQGVGRPPAGRWRGSRRPRVWPRSARRPAISMGARPRRARAGRNQQARARDRRERHRDLQLRVVLAAGARIGIGPGMVEHVLAHGMGLQIAGRGAEELVRLVLDQHMHGRPAGLAADAARIFERREKGVRDERVERIVVAEPGRSAQASQSAAGTSQASGDCDERTERKGRRSELSARRDHAMREDRSDRRRAGSARRRCRGRANSREAQGRKPSKTIWSACFSARARSSGVRTVQVITGSGRVSRQR